MKVFGVYCFYSEEDHYFFPYLFYSESEAKEFMFSITDQGCLSVCEFELVSSISSPHVVRFLEHLGCHKYKKARERRNKRSEESVGRFSDFNTGYASHGAIF